MLEAIALGVLAQIPLLLSGLVATWAVVPRRIVGWLAGFGAGALISAVAFDLFADARTLGGVGLMFWLLVGACFFIGGDRLVERRLGKSGGAGALGIVVGAVLDGIPESLIFGIGIGAG